MIVKRYSTLIIISLLILVFIIWGYWPRAVLVDAQPVVRDVLTISVEEEGKTRVIDRYVVSAPVAGYAHRHELNVGDQVEQGACLVELEPLHSQVLDPRSKAQAQSRVAAAESALAAARQKADVAKANAQYAAKDLQRKSKLRRSNTISEDQYDSARTKMLISQAEQRSAEFAVDVAGHDLQAAKALLEYSGEGADLSAEKTIEICAPVSARVLTMHRKSEGAVTVGEPLIEIGDPNALEVVVDLLSEDAVRIKHGTKVLFDRWGGETLLEGITRKIEPTGFTKVSALGIEEQRVRVIADITSPAQQWSRLGDGYRVEASFIIWQQDDILQIPTNALFHHKDGWAIFVVEKGRARLRKVKAGPE